jgi:hypothetical protein
MDIWRRGGVVGFVYGGMWRAGRVSEEERCWLMHGVVEG